MTDATDRPSVARAYDTWAARYDADPNRTRDLAATALRAQPLPLDGGDVVEAGCGTGRNTAWIGPRARSVVGLDFSDGMLAQARTRVAAPSVRFVRHDLRERWPLDDATADAVIIMLVLEHVEHLAPVFREAARVLRRAGTLFVAELHPMRQLLGRKAEYVDPATGRLALIDAHLHDTAEYVRAGLDAGLALEDLGEWRDEPADRAAPPRLISLRFKRPEASGMRDA